MSLLIQAGYKRVPYETTIANGRASDWNIVYSWFIHPFIIRSAGSSNDIVLFELEIVVNLLAKFRVLFADV